MPLTNIFEAEDLIIQRLNDKAITGIVSVEPASNIVSLVDLSSQVNKIFVEPHEGEYNPTVTDGKIQTETQGWMITLLLQSPTGTNESVVRVAGNYLSSIYGALNGFKLVKGLGELAISKRLAPVYEQGTAQFSTIFNTRLVVIGDQS